MIRRLIGIAVALLFTASGAIAGVNGTGLMVNGALAAGGVIQGVLTLTNNTTGTLPAPNLTGTVLQIGGANAVGPRLWMDAFASNSAIVFRRADTSLANKTAVQSGETIGNIAALGYGATGYSASSRALLAFVATENWSDTANGTKINFATTKNTTATNSTVGQLDGYGHLYVALAVPTISSCGTSPSAARGGDFGGEVTGGTTATGCVITFANAYATAPFCVVTAQTQQAAFAYTISTTAITVTHTSTDNLKINWICNGI